MLHWPTELADLRDRYPSSIWIPLEFIAASLGHAERLTRLHSKAGHLAACKTRLAQIDHRGQEFDVPELAGIRERVVQLEGEVARRRVEEAGAAEARERLVAMPLSRQCTTLDIPLESLSLPKRRDGWFVDGQLFRKPERAAYAYYAAQGYAGAWIEGRAALMLMHAASIAYCLVHYPYPYGKRWEDTLMHRTGFEGIAHQMPAHARQIVEAIRTADRTTVGRAMAVILAEADQQLVDPDTDAVALMTIWDGLGAPGVAQLAAGVLDDPFYFRSGWPDLTLARGNEVRFIEVKTTDKIHHSQVDTLRELLLPAGARVSVLRLVPET